MDDANLVCVLCFFLLNTRQGRMEWNLVLTFISSLGVFRHPKVAYPVGKDEVERVSRQDPSPPVNGEMRFSPKCYGSFR